MHGTMKSGYAAAGRMLRRPIGQILVDGEFISREDLNKALEEQTRTNELLGEVLVRMGVIDHADLNAALAVQGDLSSLKEAIHAAAGVRQLLGNLLIQARRITHEELEIALREQKRTGEKLGAVLVRLGMLTVRELDAVLAFQQVQAANGRTPARFRLGEILVAAGFITRSHLDAAIAKQRLSGKLLGEVLVDEGLADRRHVDRGLKIQRKLLSAALVAVLSLSSFIAEAGTAGGQGRTAGGRITISATVLPYASVKVISQAKELVVTEEDIGRGYVEVRSASRLEVKNNSRGGYLLSFEGLGEPFREVYVQGLGSDVQVGSGGGWIPRPYSAGIVSMDLTYRFVLADGARPGTYAWPLSVSARPL